eukprot:754453-Hanusia_phi.AAC.3
MKTISSKHHSVCLMSFLRHRTNESIHDVTKAAKVLLSLEDAVSLHNHFLSFDCDVEDEAPAYKEMSSIYQLAVRDVTLLWGNKPNSFVCSTLSSSIKLRNWHQKVQSKHFLLLHQVRRILGWQDLLYSLKHPMLIECEEWVAFEGLMCEVLVPPRRCP